MRLTVELLNGSQSMLDLNPHDTLDAVRDRLVEHNKGWSKDGVKLIYAGKPLLYGYIQETGIRDGDFIVAFMMYKPQSSAMDISEIKTAPGPTVASTKPNTTTNGTTPPNTSAPADGVAANNANAASNDKEKKEAQQAAVPADIRANLLDLGSHIQEIVNSIVGMAQKNEAPVEVDPEQIQKLVTMGFTEAKARKALTVNKLNLARATEWLLEHNGDNEDEEMNEEVSSEDEGAQEGDFTPAEDVAQRIREMGFSADEVNKALRVTNNNYEAACAWLLGDRDGTENDAEGGLDENNPLVSSILNNPAIQQSLTPRVIQAFQTMIENPASTQEYINDPEIGPILMQVHNLINQNPDHGGAGGAPTK